MENMALRYVLKRSNMHETVIKKNIWIMKMRD